MMASRKMTPQEKEVARMCKNTPVKIMDPNGDVSADFMRHVGRPKPDR